ncbi:MAG: Uma2 family endonuclease [Coleofasciculaceae cyanobacterium SM2_1_6]|nr:Uma2 family endonuclease [Coleofasciculaceae cyanobacterium SM2_1_6]
MAIAPQIPLNCISLEEFLTLAETKPAQEYIDGEIYQKPMPQGQHSTLQSEIVIAINHLAKPRKIAYAFPELRCTFSSSVGSQSIVPDISVLKWENIPLESQGRVANKIAIPPDWLIEILSPGQSPLLVVNKISLAIRNGSQLGWLISPAQEIVMVFVGDALPETKQGTDKLPVLDVLQDWRLSAQDIFNLLNFGI